MKFVSFDGTSLNGSNPIQAGVPNDSDRTREATLTLGERPGRGPVIQSRRQAEHVIAIVVTPHQSVFTTDPKLTAFEATVMGLFRPGAGLKPLVARRDPADPDTEMVCYGEVRSFGPDMSTRGVWRGEIVVPDGEWRALAPTTVSTSPITLSGNGDARPVVTLTSSSTGTRVRVTATDRTGDGVGGWLAGISWAHSAAGTWVWANGVPVPFRVEAGRLWFRLDINAGTPTVVDVYYIAGSDNVQFAGALDTAGTTLAAGLAGGTSVSASMTTAGRNAVSAALTWQPGITAAHNSDAPYTFGLSAPNQITLIDRTATGSRQQLADDADSLIFTSPVEITHVSAFSVQVVSGYRQPEATDEADTASLVQTQNTAHGPACLRVKVGGLSNGSFTGNYNITGPVPPNSRKVDVDVEVGEYTIDKFPDPKNPHKDDPWPEQRCRLIFALGGSQADAIRDNQYEVIILYGEIEIPVRARAATVNHSQVGEALAKAADGAMVTSDGESWVWYLTFAEGAYGGQEIPFLQVVQNTVDIATLVEQVWVDPVSLKPIVDNRDGGTPPNGQVRVVQRYRLRDDETWYTAWSQVVNGTVAAEPQTVSVPALSIPDGAVQIAIGLESCANGANAIDWGVLTLASSPTLTFMAGRAPLITTSSAIAAQRLDGTLVVNGRTAVTLAGVFCDGGLRIDADTLWVDGADGVGPVYGEVGFTEQANWIVLREAATVATTGTVDGWEMSITERWLI